LKEIRICARTGPQYATVATRNNAYRLQVIVASSKLAETNAILFAAIYELRLRTTPSIPV